MSITPPSQGPGPHQPSREGETTPTPPASQQEVQNIARETLSAEPTSSGYLPNWMTNVASYAVSSTKTLYHTYFDPNYTEAYSDMASGNAETIARRLELVLHANPYDPMLLSYCFENLFPAGRIMNEETAPPFVILFGKAQLTVADFDAIIKADPQLQKLLPLSVFESFYARREIQPGLREAFRARFLEYISAHKEMKSGDENRMFARLERVLHENPFNLDLWNYSAAIFKLNLDRDKASVSRVWERLFASKSLTAKDIDVMKASWDYRGILKDTAIHGFFSRSSSSTSLMETFCRLYRYELIRQNAAINLNKNPSLLKAFLDVNSSEVGKDSWQSHKILNGLLENLTAIYSNPHEEEIGLQVLKIYCDHFKEEVPISSFSPNDLNPMLWLPKPQQRLMKFADQNPQHIGSVVKILAFLIELGSNRIEPDPILAGFLDTLRLNTCGPLLKQMLSLGVPLRPFFSDQEWEKLEALYPKVFPNGPIFTLNEFELNELEKSAVLIGFELSTRTSIEFSAVAANVLTEAQAKDPRFLMAIAFYQWAERKGKVDEMLTISYEGAEVKLPPMLALGWLNKADVITWAELKAPLRTIECELDGKMESAALSVFDQKLLKDHSEYFSRYLANRWQAVQSPIQNIAPGAIEDLIKYLAYPFMTFEDVDAAAEMLAIADMFQVPSVVDRAVTWLNTYADSLETQEERKSFADSLRHEDSPLYNNHAILERLNLPGS